MPRLPPAPALFSTTKRWLKALSSSWPTIRAKASVFPPAANGTTIVTGLLG